MVLIGYYAETEPQNLFFCDVIKMSEQIFNYTIELECNISNNETFLSQYLENYGLSLEDIDRDFEPIESLKHRNTWATRLYHDGSVDFELVLCSDDRKSLKKAVRDFNKGVSFNSRAGQHISIKREIFNAQRLYDHDFTLMRVYCILENLILQYQGLNHRNNGYSISDTRNLRQKDDYPALLTTKEVKNVKFLEFRYSNPKKLMFLEFYLSVIPNWFNNCPITELKKVSRLLYGVSFDDSDSRRLIDRYEVRELLKADYEISKIFSFFKLDSLREYLNKYPNLSREFLTEIMKFLRLSDLDSEHLETIIEHFLWIQIDNSKANLSRGGFYYSNFEFYNSFDKTKYMISFNGRQETQSKALYSQILANILKDILLNQNFGVDILDKIESLGGLNLISHILKEATHYKKWQRLLFDHCLDMIGEPLKVQKIAIWGDN